MENLLILGLWVLGVYAVALGVSKLMNQHALEEANDGEDYKSS